MSSQIIINVTSQESRVALKEDGSLAEYYIERAHDVGIIGNIYKGRVVRILPGMQSSFIDIGIERAAFLYVDDIFQPQVDINESATARLSTHQEALDEHNQTPYYNKIASIKNTEGEQYIKTMRPRLESQIEEGQEILVQVAKEPIGNKGARLTTNISLPGRYLVLLPFSDHLGISRRIDDDMERSRLKDILERVRPFYGGIIARTASAGTDEEEIVKDLNYLLDLWKEIKSKCDAIKAPRLIYKDLNIITRTVRDLFTPDVESLIIDSNEEYENIVSFVHRFMPHLEERIRLYNDGEPIFEAYGIEGGIEEALGKRVWLKSGGYIVIEQTESLVSIDVNTGRYVGRGDLSETILKINLEAVREIVYQLRLRNIGGIIIIDYIDMEDESHKDRVFQALKGELKKDRAKSNILRISELGLLEMTRKRTRESIGRTLCDTCSFCGGMGLLKSKQTLCYEIFRKLRKRSKEALNLTRIKEGTEKKFIITANPGISSYIIEEEARGLEEIEGEYGIKIEVVSDQTLHPEEYRIENA